MNNTPDYENDLVFKPKDTNYDTLKEYEAHSEPLPSYDDWKAVNELEKTTLKDRAKIANQLVELQNKNRKLKELLKACRLSINGYPPYDSGEDILKLTYRINQALGEDK